MRFQILGSVQIGSHTPSSGKQRAILGALLVRTNEIVSASALIEELWGQNPPRTASTTLQVHISHLRKLLSAQEYPDEEAALRSGRSGCSRIVTKPSGYLLPVAPHELDLCEFESLYGQGKAAYKSQEFAEAARLLGGALGLWHGPALSGVPSGYLLETASARLTELRLDALEHRISAELRIGRHRELLVELTTLAREHPLREALHGHLMVALYRSSRQPDALRVYGRLRRCLIEELGTEPGTALRKLHQDMLRGEPSLDWRGPAVRVAAPAGPIVRLPRVGAELIGREDSLAEADRAVRDGGSGRSGPILVIGGGAGVGKTAFAVELAHRMAGRYPDGQVTVGLRDADGTPLDPHAVLVRLLHRLGYDVRRDDVRQDDSPGSAAGPAAAGDVGVGELADLLFRVAAGRRLLFVLDDVADEAAIGPILAALPDAAVVITGRTPLTGVEGARHIALPALAPAAAVELLARVAGERITEDPASAAEIARQCDFLPLALRAAGARLAAHPHWRAETMVTRLSSANTRLDELTVGELDVRNSLLAGYRQADEPEQRAFRLLSLLPADGFAPWIAAALLDLPPAAAERVFERLVLLGVLRTRPGAGLSARYEHPALFRALAAELLADEDPAVVREAMARMCAAYLVPAQVADARLTPGRSSPDGLPAQSAADHIPVHEVVGDAPLRWFQDECPALVDAVRLAHAAGLWRLTWRLADSLAGYFEVSGLWEEWETTDALALDAARQAGDLAAEAAILQSQGRLAWQRRQVEQAEVCFSQARQRAREANSARGEGRSLIGLADIALDQGDLTRAQAQYQEALSRCWSADDPHGVVDTLRGLAFTELRQGHGATAQRRFTECQRIAQDAGDRRWSEFAYRAVDRIQRTGAHQSETPLEIRPGIWWFDDADPEIDTDLQASF